MSNSTKDDNSPLGEDESATVLLITQEVDREHQPSRRRKDRNELAPHLFAAPPPLATVTAPLATVPEPGRGVGTQGNAPRGSGAGPGRVGLEFHPVRTTMAEQTGDTPWYCAKTGVRDQCHNLRCGREDEGVGGWLRRDPYRAGVLTVLTQRPLKTTAARPLGSHREP